MSRHTIRKDEQFEVVVGWDDPLGTFFGQVFDVQAGGGADDDVFLVMVGYKPGGITDLAGLQEAVASYASIPTNMCLTLLAEQENRRLPTEFQRETFTRMTGDDLP